MLKRTLTALLLIPPVVYLIGWSPKWLFLLAVSVAIVLALREYFALCRATGYLAFSWVGYVAGVALCIAQSLPHGMNFAAALLLVALLLLLIPTLALQESTHLKDYLGGVSVTVFGILYIGLTLSCLVPIRFSTGAVVGQGRLTLGDWTYEPLGLGLGSRLILLLFVVIWAGDICAYLVGRPLGRRPFFARISPRKTWEGALAGLAGSLLAAWAFAHWFFSAADGKIIIPIAAWIAIAGQVGDLVESAIKRGANQKDSGALLPGHGGFLDRIDSLIFAAPALWLALMVLELLSAILWPHTGF
jgi:phosphatidate cytidylyltransferase